MFVAALILLLHLQMAFTSPEIKIMHNPVGQEHYKEGVHDPDFDHKAILGSRAADAEFDELPPEVAGERLAALARTHDTNGDGIISKDEMIAWITQSYKSLDEEDAAEKFAEEDENKDNYVTWDEMVKKTFGHAESDFEEFRKKDDESSKEMVKLMEDDKNKFQAADVDKDGRLSLTEYYAFHQPGDHPHMHDNEINNVLKAHDKDNDGFISKEEFVSDAGDAEQRITEEENFKEQDKDGDGKLNRQEIKTWAVPDSEEGIQEEVNHLMSMADEDHDGMLTIDEIVDKQEEFVGGMSTNYGQSLHRLPDEL